MRTLSWWFPFFTVRGYIFNYAVGAFYGGLSTFGTITRMISNPKKFFVQNSRPGAPKCLTDNKFGRHSYVECKNVKLHYVSNGDPNKPLMLFLHGFPETWYSWRYQIPEFSKDYFTVALSMRGYGDSDKPRGVANYSLDKLVEDVKDVVQSLGKHKCILVSHDWGGLVGWTVAAQYPKLVDKLIICNAPTVKAWKQFIETDSEQFKKSWYVFFFNLPFLPELTFRSNDFKSLDNMFSKFSTKEEVESYKYYFGKEYGLSGAINYYRALMRGYAKDFTQQVMNKRISSPTLVIWGENDSALVSGLAKSSCQSCDDYTIKMIANCSHWTPLDKPDVVNKYIKEFVSENN